MISPESLLSFRSLPVPNDTLGRGIFLCSLLLPLPFGLSDSGLPDFFKICFGHHKKGG